MHPALVPHQLVVGALVVHRAIGRCKCLLEVILGPPLLNRVGGDWEEDPRSPDKNEGSQAYALAHPSPHTGDVSGESYAECPVALEGHNWTRDPPGKGGDLFFGRSPLTPPKSKGDQLLPYMLETTFVRAQVEKRDDVTLAEVRRPSCFDQHRLGGREEKLTQNVPRNGHRTRLRPLFPNADAQTCIPFRLAKRSSGPPGREDPGV